MKKIILGLLLSGNVLAQFVPDSQPQAPNKMDVKSAKLLGDDALVTLEGYISGYAKSMDKHEYIFTDNVETVKVEIQPTVWRNQKVTPQTKIRIVGEVDRDNFNQTIEIEVNYLEIIQ